jgi:aminopeptidase-like protein
MSIEKYYNLAKNTLFPICRSITGNGVKKTLKIIKKEFPNLKICNIPSGTKVFDWNVRCYDKRHSVSW